MLPSSQMRAFWVFNFFKFFLLKSSFTKLHLCKNVRFLVKSQAVKQNVDQVKVLVVQLNTSVQLPASTVTIIMHRFCIFIFILLPKSVIFTCCRGCQVLMAICKSSFYMRSYLSMQLPYIMVSVHTRHGNYTECFQILFHFSLIFFCVAQSVIYLFVGKSVGIR